MKDTQKQNEELMESLIRGHKKSRMLSVTEATEKNKDRGMEKEKEKGMQSTPSAPANMSLNQTPAGAAGEV